MLSSNLEGIVSVVQEGHAFPFAKRLALVDVIQQIKSLSGTTDKVGLFDGIFRYPEIYKTLNIINNAPIPIITFFLFFIFKWMNISKDKTKERGISPYA